MGYAKTREMAGYMENELMKRIADAEIENEILTQKLERMKVENNVLKNEMCIKCGSYTNAHKGACDSCRWKGETNL